MTTKVKTQDQRIAELERILATQPRWVKIAEASQALGISCSTLRRRCNSPRYRQGVCWKYFSNGRDRLFNVIEWKRASEEW